MFNKIQVFTNNLRGKERTLGLPIYELPLANVYMARGNEDLRGYLLGLWKLAAKCQRELKRLLNTHKAVENTSPSETEVPSADQMEAKKLVLDSRFSVSTCELMSDDIKTTMEEFDRLRKREQGERCTTFVDHQILRQVFLRAIRDQGNSFPASAMPFYPKPIEDASKTVRDSRSEDTRSSSESSEHQLAVHHSMSRSVRPASSRPSSAGHKGSKRKRNRENDESQRQEKRLAHTHIPDFRHSLLI